MNHNSSITPITDSLPEPASITEPDNCPFKGPLTQAYPPQNSKLVTPNSPAAITAALVERVSDRIATGFPLELALAGESVSRADYEQQLREHPEFANLANVAKRKFLQSAIAVLLNARDSSANIRWLLERLYPEVFSRNRESEDVKSGKANSGISPIVGVSDEEYLAMVEAARHL